METAKVRAKGNRREMRLEESNVVSDVRYETQKQNCPDVKNWNNICEMTFMKSIISWLAGKLNYCDVWLGFTSESVIFQCQKKKKKSHTHTHATALSLNHSSD